MKILLVEDDETISSLLSAALADDRHVVNIAADGQLGLELAEAYDYDLIVLDVMLPKLDGLSLCRELRSHGNQTPILLLTARDSQANRVAGLDAGADDYMAKPFELSELRARIRALLRRSSSPLIPTLSWEHLQLDPNTREVTYRHKPLALTPKEFSLLELFLHNPQRVFSRSTILDRLWSSEDAPTESTVTAHMKDLRHKLKAAGMTIEMIGTVYGLGYRLMPPPAPKASAEAPTQPAAATDFLPDQAALKARFLEQVAVLHTLQSHLQTDLWGQPQQEQMRQTAHRLAGALGMCGYPQGSRLAQQIEHLLQQEIVPASAAADRLVVLVSALQQVLQNPPQPAAIPMPGTIVLVITEDEALLAALPEAAAAQGIQLKTAPSLAAAQPCFRPILPDAIVLDLGSDTANRDGLMDLAVLRHRYSRVPVVILTGNDSLSDRVEVSRLGGRVFLQKPISAAQLLQALAQVLPHTATTAAKVLIVDDDPTALAGLSNLLRPWGFQVTTLDSPQRFWDVLNRTEPDLLLLDLEMPTFNGVDLCRVVRQAPQWRDLLILVVTAHTSTEAVRRAFAAGADDFITKPVVGADLVERVTNRIERARRQRSNLPAGRL